MQMQSNSGEIKSNPVFIPKRMQTQTKSSFVANGYHSNNKFRVNKEISVNGSVLPNSNFKTKTIKPLNGGATYTIPVRAEIHNEIGGHQNQLTIKKDKKNDYNLVENNQNSKPMMTAIKGILKSKTCDSVLANGVIRLENGNQTDDQIIISDQNLIKHKTHNQDSIIGNMKNTGTTPSTRRKSSSVQFDIHNIKESTSVQLNPNTRGLTSISSARRESSNSSSSLSIIQQSVPGNPVLTYDFPRSSQKLSDLRKILNPEIEKEDSLKKLGERLIHCDCFELNLNNAAKIITAVVLLATIILVLRALFNLAF